MQLTFDQKETVKQILNFIFTPDEKYFCILGHGGTGKTIFCTQFIWNALCMGENGVYVTLQQTPEDIMDDVEIFGRDFKKAMEAGQVRFVYIEPTNLKKIIDTKHIATIWFYFSSNQDFWIRRSY